MTLSGFLPYIYLQFDSYVKGGNKICSAIQGLNQTVPIVKVRTQHCRN